MSTLKLNFKLLLKLVNKFTGQLSYREKHLSSIFKDYKPVKAIKAPKLSFSEPDLNEIREQFRSFEGGKVTVTKNEETGLAFICIDHVDKKNGFSGKMMVDFNEAISSLEGWETGKGVLLYGKGDSFCSGGYLETVRQICNSTDGFKMASLMHDSMIRLRRLPLISVAVVKGKALGGGAEIILAPDFRILTVTSEIAFVEAKMGVGTGWGGGVMLKDLVGHQKALDLLLTCRKISSVEALEIHLADAIIPDDEDYLQRAVEWLNSKIVMHDPFVVQTVKQIVQCDDLNEEKRLFASSWGGKAQLKALSENIKHK